MVEFHDISEFIQTSKGALELFKSALSLMPKGGDRDKIEQKIRDAEDALRRSDAKLAKELGMHLCDCTMPPQVMLWREREKAHVCPNPECGRRHTKTKASFSVIRS